MRFSRTRLSSRQFPHRDGLANDFLIGDFIAPRYHVNPQILSRFVTFSWLKLFQRLSGRLPEVCPVCLITADTEILPSYPPSLWTVLLSVLYHVFQSKFGLVFVFSVSSWFPAGATISSPCFDLPSLTVSGRRRRAETLASVRRSIWTCSFPASSFHEGVVFRDAIEGINLTKFTNPNSP